VPLTFGVLAAVAASSPSSNDVTPGVLGFLVVAAIGVALVFLLKSMNKQFRKIAPKAEAAPADGKEAKGDLGENR
jgi:glycerol uptake facilitator-like aquaporin